MMMLESLGVLNKFPTFPKISSPYHYFRLPLDSPHDVHCAGQAVAAAEQRGARGLARVLRAAVLENNVTLFIKDVRMRSRPFRRFYRCRDRVTA
jgi:hypothetical protein